MINVRMFTEDAYRTLQKNYDSAFDEMLKHPSDDSWLKDYLGFEPYETRKYEIEDFELKYSDNYEDVAYENALILYQNLKDLPRYILYDMKFWGWLTFSKAYKHALVSTQFTKQQFRNMWIPVESSRSLTRGVISRFYFIVDMSYDETAKDPYELTPFLYKNQDIFRDISDRSIRMLKNPCVAIIKLEKTLIMDEHIQLTRVQNRQIIKDCLKLGSVRLIDTMRVQEIYDALYIRAEKITNTQQ